MSRSAPVTVATSMSEALECLGSDDVDIVAGGTDLMVLCNAHHRADLRSVVVIDRVPELRSWHHDPQRGTLTIGAGVTWRELIDWPIAQWVPALAQAARTVGSAQIRQTGTLGGNVATSSPAGDGLPPLAALNAVVHLRSSHDARDVAFTDFMVGPKRTVRRRNELITGVTVPVIDGWQGYSKVGVRNAMVISTASAALVIDRQRGAAQVALGSVGPIVIRCDDATDWLASQVDLRAPFTPSTALVDEFARRVRDAARPIDDHRSTADYRRHAVGVLAGRLLRSASST